MTLSLSAIADTEAGDCLHGSKLEIGNAVWVAQWLMVHDWYSIRVINAVHGGIWNVIVLGAARLELEIRNAVCVAQWLMVHDWYSIRVINALHGGIWNVIVLGATPHRAC